MTAEKYKLPKGWVWTKLRNICGVTGGYAFKSKDFTNKGTPVIRISNLQDGGVVLNHVVKINEKYAKQCERFLIKNGDILIAMSGATTGKTGRYVGKDLVLLNQRVGRFDLYSQYKDYQDYLWYFIESVKKDIIKQAWGCAQPNISGRELEDIDIPIPPKRKQRHIVQKIEGLLDRLNKTKQELAKIPPLLKKFRQSVLVKALSGELTKEWRKQQKDLEPVSVLLERIQSERKKQLGKKCKEPEPIDASGLSELPEGWEWAPLRNTVINAQPGFASGKKDVKDGLPHLRMNNIDSECNLNLDLLRTVPKELGKEKYLLKKGDVLICHTNSQKLVGKTAVFNLERKYAFSNHLTRIRFFDNTIVPEWVWHYVGTLWRQGYFETKCKQWVNQATIERDTLLQIPMPIPPYAEQSYAVKKIKDCFAQADTVEKSIKIAQAHCEKLTHSILGKAFRGELVEQDPDDEPASMLLKKIKSEKSRRSLHETRQKTNT